MEQSYCRFFHLTLHVDFSCYVSTLTCDELIEAIEVLETYRNLMESDIDWLREAQDISRAGPIETTRTPDGNRGPPGGYPSKSDIFSLVLIFQNRCKIYSGFCPTLYLSIVTKLSSNVVILESGKVFPLFCFHIF